MRRSRGFTLLEIMIVVAIIGILAAIAIPSYQKQVQKSNRANAQAYMVDVVNKQQIFLSTARAYATTFAELQSTPPTDVTKFYTVTLTNVAGPPPSACARRVPFPAASPAPAAARPSPSTAAGAPAAMSPTRPSAGGVIPPYRTTRSVACGYRRRAGPRRRKACAQRGYSNEKRPIRIQHDRDPHHHRDPGGGAPRARGPPGERVEGRVRGVPARAGDRPRAGDRRSHQLQQEECGVLRRERHRRDGRGAELRRPPRRAARPVLFFSSRRRHTRSLWSPYH